MVFWWTPHCMMSFKKTCLGKNTGQHKSSGLQYKYVWPIIDQMQKCRIKRKHLFVSNHWKGKGKGKIRDHTTMAIGLVCFCCVLLTFTEVEHTRQVHPRQLPLTSEEVPLLRPPTLCHTLLASCRKQRESGPSCVRVCLCVLVSLYVPFSTTLSWRGNVICALVTAFSVNILN